MPKTYTKAELFGKDMTLAKLQAAAASLNVEYDANASKAAIANLILAKQQENALTKAPDGVSDDELAEANKAAAATTAAAVEAAQGESAAASVTSDTAAAAGPAQPVLPGLPADIKTNPETGKYEFPEGFLEAISEALGLPALERKLKELEHGIGQRLRNAEHSLEGLLSGVRAKITTHGHIDDLPKPGKIDDLAKTDALTAGKSA